MLRMIVAVIIGKFIYDFTIYTIARVMAQKAAAEAMEHITFGSESDEEDDLK